MSELENKDAAGKEVNAEKYDINLENSWHYGTPGDLDSLDNKAERPSKEGKNYRSDKMFLRIAVPLILLVLIAAVWFFKESGKKPAPADNPDFALETESIDFDKLKSYGLPMLIDFGSEGCAPCRLMYPTLIKLNEEWQGKVIVKFADVWKYTSAADGYPVTVIPTQFFFYADGKPYVPGKPLDIELKMYKNSLTGEHVFTSHEGYISEDDLRKIYEEIGAK